VGLDPVPVNQFSLAVDEREVTGLADTGNLSVNFAVVAVDGVENVPQPRWVRFEFSYRVESGELIVSPKAEVDIEEAFLEDRNNRLRWKAIIDDGQKVTEAEYTLAIVDQRFPETPETLLYLKHNQNQGAYTDIFARSFVLDLQSDKQFARDNSWDGGATKSRLEIDQLNRNLFLENLDGNNNHFVRKLDLSGNSQGRASPTVDDNDPIGFGLDIVRAQIAFERFQRPRLAPDRRLYSNVFLSKILPLLTAQSGNAAVYDVSVDTDFSRFYVGGEELGLNQNIGLVRVDYENQIQYTVERNLSVEIVRADFLNEELITVEGGARYIRRRSLSDLSLRETHDFGSPGSIYGLDFAPGEKQIYLAHSSLNGIQKTSYALGGDFTQVVSGDVRYPVVIEDSKPGLDPQLEIGISQSGTSITFDLTVFDVSGLTAFVLDQAQSAEGNFAEVDRKGKSAGLSPTFSVENLPRGDFFFKIILEEIPFPNRDEQGPFPVKIYDDVTGALTTDNLWSDPAIDYSDLSSVTVASAQVFVKISAGDSGIIMESGASGDGMALFTDGERLYLGLGDGSGTSSSGATAWIAVPIPVADLIAIEWSASADTDFAVLYINGEAVGYDTFTEGQIAGGNTGGIAGTHSSLREVPGNVRADGFDGEVYYAKVMEGEATEDVNVSPVLQSVVTTPNAENVEVTLTLANSGDYSTIKLESADNPNGPFSEVGIIPADADQKTITDGPFDSPQNLYYRTSLLDGTGQQLNFTTPELETVGLHLSQTAETKTSIDVSLALASANGISEVDILRSQYERSGYSKTHTFSPASQQNQFTDGSLSSDTTYFYKARLKDGDGDKILTSAPTPLNTKKGTSH